MHFDSIDTLLGYLRAGVPENIFLDEGAGHAYEWVSDGSMGKIVPTIASSFWSPFLYRGQTKRHPSCVPVVFRYLSAATHPQQLSRVERARCFVARVRLEEFLLALAQHPASELSRQIGLAICPEAIAQHYEMATDRIDLSQDPDVAAFFATHSRDSEGRWQPISSGGAGVMYRLNVRLRERLNDQNNLEWVGKQALPRPGEQKAWVLRLGLGLDFETMPVDVFTFDHRESCARRIGERFGGGAQLFPPDVLSDVAYRIRESTSIAHSLVSRVLTLQGCPADIHKHELDASAGYLRDNLQIAVVNREPITFSPAELAEAQAGVDRMKATFLDDVSVRPVRQATPRSGVPQS